MPHQLRSYLLNYLGQDDSFICINGCNGSLHARQADGLTLLIDQIGDLYDSRSDMGEQLCRQLIEKMICWSCITLDPVGAQRTIHSLHERFKNSPLGHKLLSPATSRFGDQSSCAISLLALDEDHVRCRDCSFRSNISAFDAWKDSQDKPQLPCPQCRRDGTILESFMTAEDMLEEKDEEDWEEDWEEETDKGHKEVGDEDVHHDEPGERSTFKEDAENQRVGEQDGHVQGGRVHNPRAVGVAGRFVIRKQR